MAASMERQNLLSATNNQDTTPRTIKLSHFELALGKITPSVSEKVTSHISTSFPEIYIYFRNLWFRFIAFHA